MTAPEKAAPIPAEVLALAKSAIPARYWSGYYITAQEWRDAIACAVMQDRADREALPSLPDSREERIRAEAAEDERDRLYARAVEHRGHSNSTTRWTKEQGAMLPADRARARQGGNNG